jgi:hypothetical protein
MNLKKLLWKASSRRIYAWLVAVSATLVASNQKLAVNTNA